MHMQDTRYAGDGSSRRQTNHRQNLLPNMRRLSRGRKMILGPHVYWLGNYTNVVNKLAEDTWRACTPNAQAAQRAPGMHRADDLPNIIDPSVAVDFVKVDVGAEESNDLFNKLWLSLVVGNLTDETRALLPRAAALAAATYNTHVVSIQYRESTNYLELSNIDLQQNSFLQKMFVLFFKKKNDQTQKLGF